MTRLGKAVLTGSEILSLDEIMARIEAVTAEDVLTLAHRIFDPDAVVGGGHRRRSGRLLRVGPGAWVDDRGMRGHP